MPPGRPEPQALFAAPVGARADGFDHADIGVDIRRDHEHASLSHEFASLVVCSPSDLSSQLRSTATEAAPDCRAKTCPWCMSSSVGTARTVKRCEVAGDLSTSILTSFSW